MSTSKLLALCSAAVVVMFGAGIGFISWNSPQMAVETILKAARAGDIQTLDRLIDFPAVRDGMTEGVSETLERRLVQSSINDNEFVAYSGDFGGASRAMADRLLSQAISAQSLADYARDRPVWLNANNDPEPFALDLGNLSWRGRYVGLNRVVATVYADGWLFEQYRVELSRTGLFGWRVIAVEPVGGRIDDLTRQSVEIEAGSSVEVPHDPPTGPPTDLPGVMPFPSDVASSLSGQLLSDVEQQLERDQWAVTGVRCSSGRHVFCQHVFVRDGEGLTLHHAGEPVEDTVVGWVLPVTDGDLQSVCLFSDHEVCTGYRQTSEPPALYENPDCGEMVGPERTGCWAAEQAIQDTELNREYGALLRQLTPADREELRALERAWIADRDAECSGEPEGWRRSSCYAYQTASRRIFLQGYRH